MNQRTYLFEVVYVSYVLNVPLGSINLSASYSYQGNHQAEHNTVKRTVLTRLRCLSFVRLLADDHVENNTAKFTSRNVRGKLANKKPSD